MINNTITPITKITIKNVLAKLDKLEIDSVSRSIESKFVVI